MSPSDPQRPQDPDATCDGCCSGPRFPGRLASTHCGLTWEPYPTTRSCDAWTPLSAPATTAPETETARAPEARLRAFAERYRAQGLSCSFMAGTDVDRSLPWVLEWRRRYADADSDFRTVNGRDLADVVRQAEEWEAENDRREPEHAAPRASSPSAPSDDPPSVLADAALLLRKTYPEIAHGLDRLIREWPAPAPRDEGDEATARALADAAYAAGHDPRCDFDAEMRALLARLAELRERDADAEKLIELRGWLLTQAEARAAAAEAKLAEAEKARDEYKALMFESDDRAERRLRALAAAERRGDEAREALALVNAKLRDACSGSEPSAGHDYADEVIGLLRVARQQRDDAWKGEP